jgi:hypothetical protein
MADGIKLGRPPAEASPEATSAARWLSANKVRVAGFIMVVAQVWWMATFLSRSFFRLNDFYFLERALSSGFTWKYLTWVNAGHLTPVGFAISWVVVRISPVDWGIAAVSTLALLAWAGLALLRLLRTLFGDHPGILALMLIYLVSPLSFVGVGWWSVALEILPLEIAMFSALNSHVRYLRSGKFRHAVFTAFWLAIGMASGLKGAGVPLLLLAVTSAWLVDGRWHAAVLRTLRAHWRAWVLYAAVLGAYVGLYVALTLSPSSQQQVTAPVTFGGAVGYVRELIFTTFVPGILGGPWRWFTAAQWTQSLAVHGEYGTANAPGDLIAIALVAAAVIIAVSVWRRTHAWRSWAIALGWLLLIDSVPELLGRGTAFTAVLLGHETQSVMDAVGVLVICAGLCFLPLAGEQPAAERPAAEQPAGERAAAEQAAAEQPAGEQPAGEPVAGARWLSARPPATVAVAALSAVVLAGSVISYYVYVTNTTSAPQRSYFATAQAALGQAPAGTVILNEQEPASVIGGLLAGPAGLAANMLGPLRANGPDLPSFISRPDGTYDHLMIFNGLGQLLPAVVAFGSSNVPTSGSCFPDQNSAVLVPLRSVPTSAPTELRFGYLGTASGQIQITYAGQSQPFRIEHGLHAGFVPVQGEGSNVVFTGMSRGLCIGDVEVGGLWPASGPAVPAQIVSG